MITLFQHLDGVSVLVANVLAFFDPATTLAAAANPEKLVSGIRTFLLPLVLLGVGAISIKFLMQRQMTQFFQFAAIAILVLVLLVTPEILQSFAEWIATLFR